MANRKGKSAEDLFAQMKRMTHTANELARRDWGNQSRQEQINRRLNKADAAKRRYIENIDNMQAQKRSKETLLKYTRDKYIAEQREERGEYNRISKLAKQALHRMQNRKFSRSTYMGNSKG